MSHPLLDHVFISERYFFPRAQPLPEGFAVATSGGRLACWRSAPPSERPVLVHFHGNGEIVHDWTGDFVSWVQQLGYEVFLAEYRGYGQSEGTPQLAAMLEDVQRIVEAVGVPPSQQVAFGRSIGSLYAVEMVHRFPDTAGMVLESGIHDLLERLLLRVHPDELGCTREELAEAVRLHFDQETKLSGFSNPSLFLHAEHDHLVGVQHAIANHNASGAADKTLIRFPRGDHNSILAANATSYLQHLGMFLQKLQN